MSKDIQGNKQVPVYNMKHKYIWKLSTANIQSLPNANLHNIYLTAKELLRIYKGRERKENKKIKKREEGKLYA